MKKLALIPLVFIFALAGCAPAANTQNSPSVPSASPTEGKSSANAIDELNKIQNRVREAGFSCKQWSDKPSFPLADASGSCGEMRIAYFSDTKNVKKQIEESKKYSKDKKIAKRSWVVGKNYIIESKDAKKIGKALEADVKTF